MEEVVNYLSDVFDALGIHHSATHTEVMVDSNGVPTLIECASRLSGGLTRPAANYAVSVNAGVKARIYAAELFGVEGDQMATT